MQNLYAIFIIKKFLEVNNFDDNSIYSLINQINKEYLLLFTSLLNKNNKNLSYDTLIILVNISYTEEGELLFGEEEKAISNIATFMGNNRADIYLIDLGILLIKNITHKNSLVRQMFQNYKILQFFNEIYEKFIFDNNFMNNLILCIGHFINSRFSDNSCLISIKIIKTQLNANIPLEIVVKYVYILYNLSYYNEEKVYIEMIKNDIPTVLMNIYPFNNEKTEKYYKEKEEDINNNIKEKDSKRELCLLILKILGKMLSTENKNISKNIIDNGIAKFLNKVFQSNDIKIIKNAFFCLSNLCAGSYGQISYLYDNDTIFEAFKVAEYVYDILFSNNKFIDSFITQDFIKTFREITYVISLIIINSLYERLIPFARNHNYAIVKMLLKGLKIFPEYYNKNNKNLIIYMLNAISKLNKYEKNNDEEELLKNNISKYSEFLEQNEFKEILENLLVNPDENIADVAQSIYDEFFITSNSNDNINIDDIIEDEDNE